MNENLDYEVFAQELADAGYCAIGSLISKFKPYKGVGYSTFTKLYEQGVIPITEYCSSVWEFSNSSFAEKIQKGPVDIFWVFIQKALCMYFKVV